MSEPTKDDRELAEALMESAGIKCNSYIWAKVIADSRAQEREALAKCRTALGIIAGAGWGRVESFDGVKPMEPDDVIQKVIEIANEALAAIDALEVEK